MAGPWEKYSGQSSAKAGPWAKYGAPAAAPEGDLVVPETGKGGRVGTGDFAAPPEPDVVEDVVRSGATGFRQGLEGLAGAAGDINDINARGVGWLAEKFGASSEMASRIGRASNWLNPATAFTAMAPTTEEVQKNITKPVLGDHYRPKTMAGKYARTIGEFAPGAVAGPGGLVRKAAMTVVPAVASEIAGQMTEGTAAEPYARIGAAVLTGGVTAGYKKGNPVKQIAKGAPTREALKAETDQLYGIMRGSGIRYDANEYSRMVTRAADELHKTGFRKSTARQAYDLVDDLAADIGKSPDFDDINGVIQQVGAASRAARARGDLGTAKALGIVRDHLDDFEASAVMVSNQPMPKDVFNKLRLSAREVAKRNIKSRVLDDILENAATDSSGLDAGIRNRIGGLLRSQKGRQLFSKEDREILLDVVNKRKALRTLSKFGLDLERYSGNASLFPTLGAAAATTMLGMPAALGLATAGTVAKIAAPRLTQRAFEQASAAIRSPEHIRSPAMAAAQAKRIANYNRKLINLSTALRQDDEDEGDRVGGREPLRITVGKQ